MFYFPKPHPLSPNTKHAKSYVKNGRRYRMKNGREVLAEGVEMQDSLYYWWFEYLRLSKKYQKACGLDVEMSAEEEREYKDWWKSHGEQLHADFGDIFEVDFWDWWRATDGNTKQNRGARLFGIKATEVLDDFATFEQVQEIVQEQDKSEYALLVIPTHLTRATITKRLNKLIEKLAKEDRLNPQADKEPRAKYHPKSTKVDINSLKRCKEAYEGKLAGKTNVEIGAGNLLSAKELADLMLDRRVTQVDEKEIRQASDKKNYYNMTAVRLVKKARANIAAVERGEFPVGHVTNTKKKSEQK